MPAPSLKLAVRVVFLGKLLSTILTLSGLVSAGCFQDTSVCAVKVEAVTAFFQFEPGSFHLDKEKEEMYVREFTLHLDLP